MRNNEYGTYKVRLSKYTIKTNLNNFEYTIIDTNFVYRFVKDKRINISGLGVSTYYKFYSNGRVAEFYDGNVNFKTDNQC